MINFLSSCKFFYIRMLFVVVLVSVFGCGRSLRTLQDLDYEQKAQQSVVTRQKARFKFLLADAKRDKLKSGETRQNIISRYGQPVLVITEPKTLLYRDPVDFFNSPKVYLEFDENDCLVNIRVEEAPDG